MTNEYWDKYTEEEKRTLTDYYRCVLRKGILKEKNHLLETRHKKLIVKVVNMGATIWDIPREVFQKVQVDLIGKCMDTVI